MQLGTTALQGCIDRSKLIGLVLLELQRRRFRLVGMVAGAGALVLGKEVMTGLGQVMRKVLLPGRRRRGGGHPGKGASGAGRAVRPRRGDGFAERHLPVRARGWI